MEKKIRTELYKMTGMMVVMLGLGIYAHDFVISGIKAKVALNSSIFAIFGVAAWLAFRPVLALRNEVLALKALQEDYGQKSRRTTDPYAKPAIVFSEPELLGQGYRLITEELGRQDDLQLSNSEVQTLLHDVDQRINDRKSTILYFSGLMVFLGLLGAFMGLMKTVHAVSDLIGSMDLSGNAGADSFGKMIEGMKAPLSGMSVGFSSSLFGLMTSMVLGALERCMTSALKTLRNEFEHWLSHVTALETSQGQGQGQGDGAGRGASPELAAVRRVLESGAGQLREMRATIEAGNRTSERTGAAIEELGLATARLADTVRALSDPADLLRPVANAMAELGRNQLELLSQFKGLYSEAEADRRQMRAMLDLMNVQIARSETLDGAELHRQFDRLLALQDELATREPQPLVVVTAGRRVGLGERIPRMFRALLGWMRLVQGDPIAARREARRLRREIRLALAENRRGLRDQKLILTNRLDRLEAGNRDAQATLARLESGNSEQQARLAMLASRLDHPSVPGSGATDADAGMDSSFRDARMAMAMLQHRLNANIDPDAGDPQTGPGSADPHAQRNNGTRP